MKSTTFLFWNIGERPLEERVLRIVQKHTVDVVLLAESAIDSDRLASILPGTFKTVPGSKHGIAVFARSDAGKWTHAATGERWLVYRFLPPHAGELLIIVAHLPSKLHGNGDETQRLSAQSCSADIVLAEDARQHQRTILVGDLNMNPFEPGIASFREFHGVMSRSVAERAVRKIQTQESRMFYNPMWGLLGDRTPGPPGTYYRSAGGPVHYFWSAFDQVLLRPAIMHQLSHLSILESDGNESLLTTNGLPDAKNGSDHLPLLFRLDW